MILVILTIPVQLYNEAIRDPVRQIQRKDGRKEKQSVENRNGG